METAWLALAAHLPRGDRPEDAEQNGRLREPPSAEAIMKRKGVGHESHDVAKLKAKRQPPAAAKQPVQRDVRVLKQKRAVASAPRPRGSAAARTRANGAKAEAQPAKTRPAETLKPQPKPAKPARIEWWRGYVKSEFYAQVPSPEGGEGLVMHSPSFRWSKTTTPPKDAPDVARAHEALVSKLEEAGWMVTGCGDDWYAVELRRRPEIRDRRGEERHG